MKISVEPHFDNANSYPSDVEFEDGQHTLIIRMSMPPREIQIPYKDMIKVLKFLCEGHDND